MNRNDQQQVEIFGPASLKKVYKAAAEFLLIFPSVLTAYVQTFH